MYVRRYYNTTYLLYLCSPLRCTHSGTTAIANIGPKGFTYENTLGYTHPLGCTHPPRCAHPGTTVIADIGPKGSIQENATYSIFILLSSALTLETGFLAIIANIGPNGFVQENTTYFTYTLHSGALTLEPL